MYLPTQKWDSIATTNVYNLTCRICMGIVHENETFIDDKLEKLYEFCLGISLPTSDSLNMLCTSCTQSLKEYEQFKKKALRSNSLWNSFYNNNAESQGVIKIKSEKFKMDVGDDSSKQSESVMKEELEVCYDDNHSTEYINEELESFENEEHNKTSKYDCCNSDAKRIMDVLLKCKKCHKEYRYQKAYKRHIRQCKSKKRKIKTVNNILTEKEKVLKNSSGNNIPLMITQYVCGFCDFETIKYATWKDHMNVHWTNDNITCAICDFKARDKADYFSHRFKHYPEGKRHMQCHLCEKRFIKTLYLEFHYRSVHLGKPGGLCTQCSKTFTRPKTWRNHERFHREANFICDFCGRKFLFRNTIIEHMTYHSNISRYVCDVCGKGFKRLRSLNSHKDRIHIPQSKIKCDHCNKEFKSKITYDEHMKRVTMNKPYKCDVCLRRYPSQRELEKHVFWHTGDQPYVCYICDAKYKAKSSLKVHLRIHSGYKPYKCAICDKNFVTVTQMRRHQSVHTGVRPHKCTECDRTFAYKKLLREHYSKRHQYKAEITVLQKTQLSNISHNKSPV